MNKKPLIIALLAFIWGCGNADDHLTKESSDLKIKTVNESNQAFEAQAVRWWYPDRPEKKFQLACKTNQCSEWIITTKISAPIVIHADTSVVKKDDESCWDLYSGKVSVEKSTPEVLIVMTYTNTACSAQSDTGIK